jgi:erythromycin esterase-like protein
MSQYLSQAGGEGLDSLLAKIRAVSRPLNDFNDLDMLMDEIGDARLVLLGEASHGTSQFYRWRARISQRLIEEKAFSFVSVEGDWPDCYQANRYALSRPDAGGNARQVLTDFKRWPTWMWANWEVAAFLEWLRRHNENLPEKQRAGFYGLDVYSLWESMESILGYLDQKDPEAARAARRAYACFEPYGGDEQRYAWSTRMVPESCEDEVIDLLMQLRRRTKLFEQDREGAFSAEQNALVMVNAEHYYRAMVHSDANSWNVRDEHMMDTFDRLMDFYGPQAKGIVWAHNTHVGDARYTDMARAGMFNIGQLARQRHAEMGVQLVGFGTYSGSVIAGDSWGAPMEKMPVPAGRPGSWEDVLHRAGAHNQLLILPPLRADSDFTETRGHRAIGVVYQPTFESYGNYVPTELPNRYDAFLFIDETEGLHPMHLQPDGQEMPETYPWGL